MADMPPTLTFIAHRWATFMLLVVLVVQLILWGCILLTILILIILTFNPFDRLMPWGFPFTIVAILTTPWAQLPVPVLAWAFLVLANLHPAFQALHSEIHALTSFMKALICDSATDKGSVLTSNPWGRSPWSPAEAALVVTCHCPQSKACLS